MKSSENSGLFLRLSIACFALLANACAQQQEEEAVAFQAVEVEIRDMRITAEATGEIEPIRKVEVKSKASGEILDLYVDSGDKIEPGALLARVDPRDVRNAHDQATADLEVAKARMKISEAQLARSEELFRSEVMTAQEYESRQLEHANAQAALVRATTNLELAELRLTDVTIRAPMSGTILEKLVEEGQVIQSATGNVSGGTTLLIMANLDDMRVRTLVDETDVGQLSAGMPATVSVEAFPDRTFRGEIEKIEPQATVVQNVTMFPVIVLLDNRAGLLKPGMNAEVEVLVDERMAVVAVPNNAVVQPLEVAPAAEVLGLDPGDMVVDRSVWAGLMAEAMRAGSGAGGGGGAGGGAGAAAGAGAGGGVGAVGGGDANPAMAEFREKMASGEISRDSARVLMAARRGRRGGAGGAGGTGGAGRAGGAGAAGRAGAVVGGAAGGAAAGGVAAGRGGGRAGFAAGGGRGGSAGDRTYQPAVAFVVDEAGNVESRPVMMGLTDWDYAEIVAGLKEGEQVALIGAAQLQAQQAERMQRIRSRMGGGRPFGG